MLWRKVLIGALGLCTLALSLGATDAHALTVNVLQRKGVDLVVVRADPGEKNDLSISPVNALGVHMIDYGAAQRVVHTNWCETDEITVFCGLRAGVGLELRVVLRDEADAADITLCEGAWFKVSVSGGDGADVLSVTSPARNLLRGGHGPDQMGVFSPACPGSRVAVTYSERKAGVTASLDGQANDGRPGEGDLIVPGVREIIGGQRADTLRGDGHANVLQGRGGADTLSGGGGHDSLVGGAGPDTFRARDGFRDDVSGGPEADRARVDHGLDLLSSIELLF